MALKHKIAKIEEVEEPVRGFYEAGQDGAFYLQVEGMVPKGQLDEFRENNIKLLKEKGEIETKYKDIDPVKYKELLATSSKTPEEIENAVKARLKQMSDEHTTTVTQLNERLSTLNGQLNIVLVDGSLKSEAAKAGVLPMALDDVVLRGRTVFRAENGKLVARSEKGDPLYDKNGTDPLAVGTWLKDLKKNAPHLFQGMQGGGGGGAGPRGPNGLDMSKATSVQKIAAGLKEMAPAPGSGMGGVV